MGFKTRGDAVTNSMAALPKIKKIVGLVQVLSGDLMHTQQGCSFIERYMRPD
jgi:hypothetical protein